MLRVTGYFRQWKLIPWTYRTTVVLYLVLFCCIVIPKLVLGEAIIPTSLSRNAGLGKATSDFFENPQWSDYMNVFMPTMYAHLNAPASGMAPTWNPFVEMGRPLRPEWGFSTAYPFTWLLTLLTHDVYILATIFTFHICLLAGLWLIGIAKELHYDPLAAFVVASLVATAPYLFQLLTHYTYIAMPAGFFGVIYLLMRWQRTRDVFGALGIVWQCYSFVVMSYYQEQVYGYYMLIGFVLVMAWHMRREPRRALVHFGSFAGLVAIAGLLLIPYLYDFVQNVRLSVRTENTFDFFVGSIATNRSLDAMLLYYIRLIAPELVGSPRVPELPQPTAGFGMSPVIFAFALLGVIKRLRAVWYWLLMVVLLLVVNSSETVFRFMFDHLFFNLSRTKPAFIMVIPMVFLALAGADVTMRALRDAAAPVRRAWFSAGVTVCIVGATVVFAGTGLYEHAPDWIAIATNIVVAVLCVAAVATRRAWVWPVLVAVSVAGISWPYALWNRRDQVVVRTPFVTAVRKELANGGRFGRTYEFGPVLTPNSSVLFGIPTVHALNAILPARYVAYIETLGGTILNHYILSKEIAPDYGSLAFWMSDIRVMGTILDLSPYPELEFAQNVAGLKLYRVKDAMGCCIQVDRGRLNGSEMTMPDPRPSGYTRIAKTLDLGDIYEVTVEPHAQSMVVISQQYHPQWRAFGLVNDQWVRTDVVAVNGFFQGALVPEGATRVRFEFRPVVRYAWSAHLFFFTALFAATAWRLRAHWYARTPRQV